MALPGPRLAVIFGGSGFVGRYVARRLAKDGWRVRVVSRRPNEALFVRTFGAVGQVEPVFGNIRDDASVSACLSGADAVVNCVGILAESGRNTFDALQAEGADRVARLARQAGVARVVQVSAIGADPDSDSAYARTKAAGEAAVLRHYPDAVVVRPSIVFGPEDKFFNRFAAMARRLPVLPVVGPETKFQPVFVDDVAHVVALGAEGRAAPGVYEVGGPDVDTFRELMTTMLAVIKRRALLVRVPFFAAHLMGMGLDLAQRGSFGLFTNGILTRDQVRNLARDNVVTSRYPGFGELGITPTSMEAILPMYLWRFRRSGQYAEIKESARNLRT